MRAAFFFSVARRSTTRPTIHAGAPSIAASSSQKQRATSASRRHTSSPPDVSAEKPSRNWKTGCRSATLSMPAMTGSVSISMSTAARWFSARFVRWPRIPKPVTSVAASAPYVCINRAAVRLSRAIDACAVSYALSTCSLVRSPRLVVPWCPPSHCLALTASCVPSGLVSTMTLPGTADSGAMTSSTEQIDDATPPTMHHGLSTVWPPETSTPASSARSEKPRISSFATMRRGASGISRLRASAMSRESTSVTPTA
mmetsp:Transcript_17288/g.69512  ORF Transcript_17288/g.69512 Transcript_17288/m.69512 type:complete len:256 (-) Transcript_17288:340-1107(-)